MSERNIKFNFESKDDTFVVRSKMMGGYVLAVFQHLDDAQKYFIDKIEDRRSGENIETIEVRSWDEMVVEQADEDDSP